jgi:hypothetical protein
VVLKAADTWPRTARVYCHPAESWPEPAEIVEEVPVRVCRRLGVAIDLVLDRARENRPQIVFLPAGDYGVAIDGEIVAVVERKSLADLSAKLVDGGLAYAMAELATVERAALVVEDRYSALFKLAHVNAGWVADLLAAVQVRYPGVPIVFCETRPLAEEWTFRFLGAASGFCQAGAPARGPRKEGPKA